jgi:hypothetical protein
VARCKWALQGEDSLVEIAPRYQTNWLQLWYLNPFMGHPDHAYEAAGQAAPGVRCAGMETRRGEQRGWFACVRM